MGLLALSSKTPRIVLGCATVWKFRELSPAGEVYLAQDMRKRFMLEKQPHFNSMKPAFLALAQDDAERYCIFWY